MAFWQNMFSTFIGAFLGFASSIVLFYCTNKWRENWAKKSLLKNLKNELEFNNHFLKSQLDDLNKVIEKISVNDTGVYYYFDYSGFQRLFMNQYFQLGYLYQKLSPSDINLIDKMWKHMTDPGSAYINNSIQQYKKAQLPQKEMMAVATFERNSISNHLSSLSKISKDLF